MTAWKPGLPDTRAQSNVVGVCLLLGITVLALGTLVAGIGVAVDEQTAAADADRMAATLERALEPVEATGRGTERVTFASGSLRVATRQLRLVDGRGIREELTVDALVYETRGRRVVSIAGAVVRVRGGNSRMVSDPPVTLADGTVVVGAAVLNTTDWGVGGGRTRRTLVTNVSHERRRLGTGHYRLAIETTTPGAWTRFFRRLASRTPGASASTAIRDFDGDGVVSVVGRIPGRRTAYLVVHDVRVEVRP